MDINGHNSLVDRVIWLLTVALLVSMTVFQVHWFGRYLLMVATGLVWVLMATRPDRKTKFEMGGFHWYLLLFSGFILGVAPASWAVASTVVMGITIIQILICMSVFYLYYQNDPDVWRPINALRWANVFFVVYIISFVGIDSISSTLTDGARIENEDINNTNMIGMTVVIALTITAYELLYRRVNYLALISAIPCVVVIAATASRTALVAGVGSVFLLALFRFQSRNIVKNLVASTIVGALILGMIWWALSTFTIFSGVMERMDGLVASYTGKGIADNSANVRNMMVQIGFDQFMKTPFIGIGINASHVLLAEKLNDATYLHNNYVELLCCGGIVGFFIYYSAYAYLFATFVKSFHRDRDGLVKLCLTLLLLQIMIDWGTVSYYNKLTYYQMICFFILAKNLRRETRRRLWA